jgi:hypothetical protein
VFGSPAVEDAEIREVVASMRGVKDVIDAVRMVLV